MTTTSQDRRQGTRITQSRSVKVYDPATGRYVAGQTCDTSPTGLRLELPASAPVMPGRIVHVHIAVERTPLVQKTAMHPARVVWTRRTENQTLTTGVQLLATAAAAAA